MAQEESAAPALPRDDGGTGVHVAAAEAAERGDQVADLRDAVAKHAGAVQRRDAYQQRGRAQAAGAVEGIPARPSRVQCRSTRNSMKDLMKVLASAAMFPAALTAAYPGAASTLPKPSDMSLCQRPEAVLFSCWMKVKVVSICS